MELITAQAPEAQPQVHRSEVESGAVSFATRENTSWHSFANHVFDTDSHISTADMLKGADLAGWDVRLEALTYPEGYRSHKDTFAVIRTNPRDGGTDVLSVVGDRYKTYQNEELFAFGDNLTDGAGEWDSAGSFKNGCRVFGSILLNRELVLDEQGVGDKVKHYLLLTTSHDGSSSIQAHTTPTRVLCQNSLSVALSNAVNSFKVRHTQGTAGRIAMAKQVLGLSSAYLDEFDILARELFETEITNQKFQEIYETIYPQPEADLKASLTKWQEKADFTQALYLNSPTQTGITGTAWGALNALTERLDWYRDGGKGQTEGLMVAASGFETGIQQQKNKILSVVKELTLA